MIVAIDGPAGSGKSTVARRVAERLGFHYLDTGAMYRSVAVEALRRAVPLDDEVALATIAREEPVAFEHADGSALPTRVTIAGLDVTDAIRTPEADAAVSPVARVGAVREALVAQQRRLAGDSDIVVEGRDIGTVVFPDADLKVYLTASDLVRAERRALEQQARGLPVEREEVLEGLRRRDTIDSTREHSPLAIADDAIIVDTSDLTIEQVVDRVADLALEAGP